MKKVYYCYPFGVGPDFKHGVKEVTSDEAKELQEKSKYMSVGFKGFLTDDLLKVVEYLR